MKTVILEKYYFWQRMKHASLYSDPGLVGRTLNSSKSSLQRGL